MIYQLAIFLLLLMNLLDVVFTQNIISVGGSEANPLALWIIENYGFRGLLLFKTLIVGLLFLFANKVGECSKNIRVVFWLGISIYAVLTVYHIILKMFYT